MTLDASLLGGLRQPDATSCGPSALVAARMLVDPAFATSVHELGWDREVLATHRRVDGVVAADGRLQLPWVRALGTSPWALARELGTYAVPGVTSYAVRLARVDPGRVLPAVHAAVARDVPVPLYVGSRWCPRHVVLAVGTRTDPDSGGRALGVYDPAAGQVLAVPDERVTGARLALAGWSTPWFAVLPR